MSDFISRKEAVDRITDGYQNSDGGQDRYAVGINVGLTKALNALKDVPSAEPERKTGHWVYDENGMDWNLPAWVCSECHGRNGMIPTYIRGKDKMIKVEHPLRWAGSKYCPNCGAKMEAEHETD